MPTTHPRRSRIGALRSRVGKIAGLAATPLLPEDYIDLVSPLSSRTELRGRIVGILPETADAATLTIKPGRTWKPHTAGQYIRVGVDIDGIRQWRAYSLTSPASRPDGCITVTVKAMPDGFVSNHLVHKAETGMIVQLDQACGEFTLGETVPRKSLFVTAGSGITPAMGMLRSHIDELEDVVVVHSAPTKADVIFGDELRDLHRNGQITLIERHTDSEGMIDTDLLETLVPDIHERETWACGPTGMLDSLESHFADSDLAHLIHTERFRPSVIVPGEGGAVTFSTTGTTVDADGGRPILDVGEEAGVLMPSGCRMGICYGCVVPLREGAVRDLRSGDLTEAKLGDDVRIQTCVSAAAGPCNIDL
ncbi:MAG: ferredoxin reductase [Solirubrobacterales bacterium]